MNGADAEKAYSRIISHQLKSPLHAIESLLQTVLEGYAGDISPQTRISIEKALTRTAEAAGLISDLLAFEGYGNSGKMDFQDLDLTGLLADLVRTYTPRAAEKDQILKTSLPGTAIILSADKHALGEAFKNLIENAIKYTPSLGEIQISCEVRRSEKEIEVRIQDTGYGIPAEEMDMLFHPFFRSVKHKKKIPGTGLGLAIVKRVIESHGGKVYAESTEGRGTRFTITLEYQHELEASESGKTREQVVIIGGVVSGPKAAARLRRLREDIDITVIEEREFLTYTGCELPEYITGEVNMGSLLSADFRQVRNAQFFQTFKNITAYNNCRALRIDRKKKEVIARDLMKNREVSFAYDKLLLATGSTPSIPQIPGIDNPLVHMVYSLEDARKMKQRLAEKPAQECCVIGGGLLGVTLSQMLVQTGTRITVIEKGPWLLHSYFDKHMAARINKFFAGKGIRVLCGTAVVKISGGNSLPLHIETDRGDFSADFILLSAGVRPNTGLAADAGLELGPEGGIRVDEHLQTSDPDIFAAGDCVESPHTLTSEVAYWPLGSVSLKMGRTAADSIAGRETEFTGSLGTTLFSCFGCQAARTGLTERAAKKQGYAVESTIVSGNTSVDSERGLEHIFLYLICDRKSGILLGVQGVGGAQTAAKISLAAACISKSMTLDEIAALDLGYSPGLSEPIDILQTGCMVLKNKLDGLVETMDEEELLNCSGEAELIQIRSENDGEQEPYPGSIRMTPEQLRFEDIKLNQNKPIVIYSKTSRLAYEAARFLTNNKYQSVKILEGGSLFWK